MTVAKDLVALADLLSSRLQDVMAPDSGIIGVEGDSSFESMKGAGIWDGLPGQTHPNMKDRNFWSSLWTGL